MCVPVLGLVGVPVFIPLGNNFVILAIYAGTHTVPTIGNSHVSFVYKLKFLLPFHWQNDESFSFHSRVQSVLNAS